MKIKSDECEALEINFKSLAEEKEALKQEITEKTKVIDLQNKDIRDIKKENDTAKGDLNTKKVELDKIKHSEVQQSTVLLRCYVCEVRVKSQDELKTHNNRYHKHSKGSQYEIRKSFEQFKCYYCDETINSEKDLKAHLLTCQIGSVPKVEADSYTCEICQARCIDMHDLERHLTAYHYPKSNSEEFDGDCFQCDQCPLNYKKRIDLDFHKRGYHWGPF